MITLTYSLGIGLLLSAILGTLIVSSLLVNPEIWVDDYPPDVKDRFGPISEKARQQRRWVAIPFFLVPPVLMGLSLSGLAEAQGTALTFGQILLHAFIVLEVFNLFDLLILDWLFFVKIQPARIILPGTEGHSGYKDYRFHFRGFLFGNLLIAVVSLVFAAVAAVFI